MTQKADLSKSGSLWRRYIVALMLIVAVILTSHGLETHALKSARHDANLINLSGKQRMLSQQIVLYSKTLSESPSRDMAELLTARIDQLEISHKMLMRSAITEPMMANWVDAEKQALVSRIEVFIADARSILADPGDVSLLQTLFDQGQGPLLTQLDDSVAAFETVAKKRAQRMHNTQELTLLVALTVIILEAIFIFLPADRLVRTSIRALRDEIDQHSAANQRLSNFVDIASDLYWETDLDGKVEFVEGRFLQHMKGSREDILGCNYADLISLDERQTERMQAAFENLGDYHDVRAEFVDAEGIAYMLSLSGKPRFGPNGRLLGYIGKAHDVTADTNLLGEVTRLSLTDPLTQVGNKRSFERDLQASIQTATDERPVSLLAIDLDKFKPINDTHGHGAGDFVLKTIASRIRNVLRSDDWVARVGGDEFCVVCPNSDPNVISKLAAHRIAATAAEPIELPDGQLVRVTLSIGVAAAPHHGDGFQDLINAADEALYDAKKAGRNLVKVADKPALSKRFGDKDAA